MFVYSIRIESLPYNKCSRKLFGLTFRFSGEGFNWADSFHSRAQRAANVSVPSVTTTTAASSSTVPQQRAPSVNTTTTPTAPPPQEVPKAPKVPDPFQERILKGDFYMD